MVLVVDRSDAPLRVALSVARLCETNLEIVWLAPTAWRDALGYAAPEPARGGPWSCGAVATAVGVRATLRRLEERLAAENGTSPKPPSIRLAEAPDGVGDLAPVDLVLLGRPALLAAVVDATACIYVPGPGRDPTAAVVAFASIGDVRSVHAARDIAIASGRRFALVRLGPGDDVAAGETEPPLWTQDWPATDGDVPRWLGAASPAGLVLPPGDLRRRFAAGVPALAGKPSR